MLCTAAVGGATAVARANYIVAGAVAFAGADIVVVGAAVV